SHDEQRQDERGNGQSNGARHLRRGAEQALNVAELSLRGANMLLDIQLGTLSSFWQMQARSAAAFGAPDCSDLLRLTRESAQRLMSTSAEQMLVCARRATDTLSEMQAQVGRIVEEGTQHLTDEIRSGVEELGERTQQGLATMSRVTRQNIEKARQMQNAQHDETQGGREQESSAGKSAGAAEGGRENNEPRPS